MEIIIQTSERPDSPSTWMGCDLGWVSPVPSCPYSLLPHAIKSPLSRRAKLWKAPTAISLTLARPCTRTGVDICFLQKILRNHKIFQRLKILLFYREFNSIYLWCLFSGKKIIKKQFGGRERGWFLSHATFFLLFPWDDQNIPTLPIFGKGIKSKNIAKIKIDPCFIC